MPVSIERDLDILEKSLTALKVDYERFFAGGLRTPPAATRRKIDEYLRRVGNVQLDRAAEQFRLQTLEGRYMAMKELWDKRLAAKEEGRSPLRVIRTAPAAASAPPATPSEPPPARRSRRVSSDGEGSTSVKAIGRGDLKSLFDRFCAARTAAGEDVSKLRFERFEDLVKRQAAEIRRATGATRLAFEVQTRDGKVRLVGRPLSVPAKGNP
ncbi:MAG TPA: MXAN_5187 C-terminal domain-containing protein [Thermoanaerobaculia bacterium]|nr:MXAN_5187 C-terminal domain-containing protein [Thermoanaerobaculia bacterium]